MGGRGVYRGVLGGVEIQNSEWEVYGEKVGR